MPLLGALREGPLAMLYPGVYLALFPGLFVGFWQLRIWAYRRLVVSAGFYTVDNLRYVLDEVGMKAQLGRQLTLLGGVRSMVDEASMVQNMSLIVLLCGAWFVLYVRRRRDALRV